MCRWLPLLLLTTLGCNRGIQAAYDALPAEGTLVPAFDFSQLDGGRTSATQLAGKPAVLALWSSTCSASREALVAMATLQKRYAAQGVQLVVIANDAERATVQRVLDSAGVPLPVALAAGQITATFAPHRRWPWQQGVALPSFLVLDADGRVRGRIVGLEADPARHLHRVRSALDQLLIAPPPTDLEPDS